MKDYGADYCLLENCIKYIKKAGKNSSYNQCKAILETVFDYSNDGYGDRDIDTEKAEILGLKILWSSTQKPVSLNKGCIIIDKTKTPPSFLNHIKLHYHYKQFLLEKIEGETKKNEVWNFFRNGTSC